MAKRILIVDDFEYNLAFEKNVIEHFVAEYKTHIDVDVSMTVSEAIQKIIDNDPYDAIIVDINLPDGSGLQIAQEAAQKSERTKVAALTLYPDVCEEHKELFDLVFRKPISPMSYKHKFETLLSL